MPSRRTVIALALLAPWAAWATVRVGGLDVGHPLVAAMAFTPYAAASSVLPLAVAVGLRAWRVAVLAGLVSAVSVVLVLPRAAGEPRSPAGGSGRALTVMTANLFRGRADVRAVLALAIARDVDVLALQELTPEALRRFDAAGGRERFPSRAAEARPGAAGSALLSRGALTDRAPDDATGAEQPEATLRLPGAPPLRVKVVHPRPPISPRSEPEWQASLERMPRPDATPRGPLRLLIGDFNATLDHRALQALLDAGYDDAADVLGAGLEPTWPRGGRALPITIDHVLLDERLGVRALEVLDVPGSDHRAVVAALVLPRG